MLLSLFTPTHNPQYLVRLARSIANQAFTNFEWVIVPNGDAGEIHVDLPQARIVPYTGQTQNIGELKRFACQTCRGDVLVEVDHDDELPPTVSPNSQLRSPIRELILHTRTPARSATGSRGSTTRISAGATARSPGMASPVRVRGV